MELKITNEEINLINALYWWQMTGNWPRRIDKKILSSNAPQPEPLPREKLNRQ